METTLVLALFFLMTLGFTTLVAHLLVKNSTLPDDFSTQDASKKIIEIQFFGLLYVTVVSFLLMLLMVVLFMVLGMLSSRERNSIVQTLTTLAVPLGIAMHAVLFASGLLYGGFLLMGKDTEKRVYSGEEAMRVLKHFLSNVITFHTLFVAITGFFWSMRFLWNQNYSSSFSK